MKMLNFSFSSLTSLVLQPFISATLSGPKSLGLGPTLTLSFEEKLSEFIKCHLHVPSPSREGLKPLSFSNSKK
jgi:hypothetical protein